MSDTNNAWSETITRAEVNEMVDAELSDDQWYNLKDDLDDAVAGIFSTILGNYDVR